MKSFAVVALLMASVALASAEPPRFRTRFFSQRQEQDPQATTEAAAAPAAPEGSGSGGAPYPPAQPAPYPPSNWKPSGRLFALPARIRDTYGPPPQQPEPEATEAPEEEPTTTAATDEDVTTEPEAETIAVDEKAQRLTQGGPGFYYVQLPQLQQQPQQAQQLVYLAPTPTAQVQSAKLQQFPVAQPLIVANQQPLVVQGVSGYYVSQQSW